MGLTNASVFIAAIAISVIVGVLLDPPAPASKKELLRALERTAASVDVGRPTIVLGVNVNLDLVVDALPVLKAAGIEPPAEAADVEQISSSAELAGAFAHFFGQGAAGERFVEDDQLFKRLVTAALTFQQAEARTGGNAALMANRMAQLGVRAVLSGGAGPRLREVLESGVEARDHVESDEVHLILEFKEGESWGPFTTSRANRFIVSNDRYNGAMMGLESFSTAVHEVVPDAVVLSGVHMLVAQEPEARSKRLQDVRAALTNLPEHLLVHLELASMPSRSFMREVADTLFPVVDSIGLNEQEFAFLYESVLGAAASNSSGVSRHALTAKAPDLLAVTAATDALFTHFPLPQGSSRGLTRVHLHSLGLHIIAQRSLPAATGKHPRAPARWAHAEAAVAKGALAATFQACAVTHESQLHGNDLSLLAPMRVAGLTLYAGTAETELSAASPVLRWAGERGSRFVMAPVLVCQKPRSTVGLGDAISASALAAQTLVARDAGRASSA